MYIFIYSSDDTVSSKGRLSCGGQQASKKLNTKLQRYNQVKTTLRTNNYFSTRRYISTQVRQLTVKKCSRQNLEHIDI